MSERTTLKATIGVGLALWLAAIATETFWLIGVAALIVAWATFNLLRPQ